MAYPATTSSGAVLDARSASLLPPGLEAGAPVVDPREDQDDDADEMDLFLLQTEDEIQRQEPSAPIEPSTPNVSYTQSTVHVKQESPYSSPLRPRADEMNGVSSAERKRKRAQAGNKAPSSPQRRSASRHSEHEEDLLFHLKRKRASSGSASRSAGQGAPRHLATDQPVATARGVVSSSRNDQGTYDEEDVVEGQWDDESHAGQEKEDEVDDYVQGVGSGATEEDDQEDQPLGQQVLSQRRSQTSVHAQPNTPPQSANQSYHQPSDMEESDGEQRPRQSASRTLVQPKSEHLPVEAQEEYVEETAVQDDGQDPMTFTWADMVTGPHEQVWDDSELVDTWSQAEAEYAILQERREKHREALRIKALQSRNKSRAEREARNAHASKVAASQPEQSPQDEQQSESRALDDSQAQASAQPGTHAAPNTAQPPPPPPENKPPTAPGITLPPVPPSEPGTGSGALSLTHDEIMQNMCYSSFYFGYYRALADVSRQGQGSHNPASPSTQAAQASQAPSQPLTSDPALAQTVPPAQPQPISSVPPPTVHRGSVGPPGPLGPTGSTVHAATAAPVQPQLGQPMMPYSPYAMPPNMYPGAMPYMPMPYPQAMWPQYMPPMGQQ